MRDGGVIEGGQNEDDGDTTAATKLTDAQSTHLKELMKQVHGKHPSKEDIDSMNTSKGGWELLYLVS